HPSAADHLDVRWIPETILANTQWGQPGSGRAFAGLEDVLLPALVNGWATSGASALGHVWYSVTDAGAAALVDPPAVIEPDPAADDALPGAYIDALNAHLAHLDTADVVEPRELGL